MGGCLCGLESDPLTVDTGTASAGSSAALGRHIAWDYNPMSVQIAVGERHLRCVESLTVARATGNSAHDVAYQAQEDQE